jgi:hypothetical protein
MELMRNMLFVVGAFFFSIILSYSTCDKVIVFLPAVAERLFCACLANINNPAKRNKKTKQNKTKNENIFPRGI